MIPFVSHRQPFIELLTSTAIQNGQYLFRFLKSITNSSIVMETNTAVEKKYYAPPVNSLLPRGFADEAYTASLLASFFVLYSVYQFFSDLPPVSINVVEPDWLERMPTHIHQKIEKLKQLSALNSQLSLFHVLTGVQPSHDEVFVERQLDSIMRRMNDELFEFFDSHRMPANALFFDNAFQLFEEQPERMLSCNATFIQLIALANKSKDTELRTRAHRLYEHYLNDREVKRYTRVFRFGDPRTHAVNWNDDHAVNYIFLADNELKIAVLVSQHTLDKILHGDSERVEKGNLALYDAKGSRYRFGDYPLPEFYRKYFPLFMEGINRKTDEENFYDLLKIIIPEDEEMRELFFTCRKRNHSAHKLTGEENGRRLKRIFSPSLTYSRIFDEVNLSNKHSRDLIDSYGLSDKSDLEKASLLLSLSAFFTKCASAEIFATEDQSPVFIRLYAWALMEKAHRLDSTIFGQNIIVWKNILLGDDVIPTYLSSQLRRMTEYHKFYFPEMLAKIMPDVWS